MKKIKFMTNYEYVKKHFPDDFDEIRITNDIYCPFYYGLDDSDEYCSYEDACVRCYSKLAKKNGKYVVEVIDNA